MTRTLDQIRWFTLVGVGTNAAGYLVYLGLTAAGVAPKLTMTLLYAVGTGLSFLGNRRLAFQYAGRARPAAMRFVAVYVVGWLINFAMLHVFVDRLGHPHQAVQAVAIVVVAALLFFAQRFYVFAD